MKLGVALKFTKEFNIFLRKNTNKIKTINSMQHMYIKLAH